MFVFLFTVSAALTMTAVATGNLYFLYAAIALFVMALWQERLKEKGRDRQNKSDAAKNNQSRKTPDHESEHAHRYAEAYIQGRDTGYEEGRKAGYAAGYAKGYGEGLDANWGDSPGEKESILFNPWQVLEISPNSSQETIHKAFREQSKLYHPDLVSHLGRHLQEEAELRTKDINRAYDMLRRR